MAYSEKTEDESVIETDLRHLEQAAPESREKVQGTEVGEVLPRPSNDPNDPLNWSWWEKHLALSVVAAQTFQGGFDAGSASAGLIQQSAIYQVSVSRMLQATSAFALLMAFGGCIWVPFAHRYGRRPILILAALIAAMGTLAGAVGQTYGVFVGSRILLGFGASASMSLGSLMVTDMFFTHERGQKMGIWIVFFAASPYLSTLLDGLVVYYADWRWMMWVTFFMWCLQLVWDVFLLPETLYQKRGDIDPVPQKESWLHRLRFRRFDGHLTAEDFYKPFMLWKYPSIIFPAIYYGNMYGFCAFASLGILPYAFPEIYGFSPIGQGLMALPLFLGTVIGEPLGGPFSDWVFRIRSRKAGARHPEQRLQAIWPGAIVVPVGLAMLGLFLHFEVHWIGPAIAIFLFSLGMQNVVTVVITYSVDCYTPLAAEIGLISNVGRQLCSFYVFFYLDAFIVRAGFGWVFGTYAIAITLLFGLILSLMKWGMLWRQKLALPSYAHAARG
ncbi:uncharacterized protein PV07_04828 [Cladophialophora immunda]|uniref:Major facilitator superfamily (MFS) profile domain-containing protein n=1 Tax=Cladophialophora immunda TaxID=569365 RepID=A0A0D2AUR2_9EURO|nr:uncharacterized protein PV07_04828 [Cladophialophora immunda]KIW28977.1 hypothetical protein PV07_04828 [Cladophialophora immunda]